jgi:hypothetical protein
MILLIREPLDIRESLYFASLQKKLPAAISNPLLAALLLRPFPQQADWGHLALRDGRAGSEN